MNMKKCNFYLRTQKTELLDIINFYGEISCLLSTVVCVFNFNAKISKKESKLIEYKITSIL